MSSQRFTKDFPRKNAHPSKYSDKRFGSKFGPQPAKPVKAAPKPPGNR